MMHGLARAHLLMAEMSIWNQIVTINRLRQLLKWLSSLLSLR